MASKLDSAFLRLGNFQFQHPIVVLVLAFLTLVPAGYATSQLTLRTSFSELLPDNKPSVIEMRRVEERLASAGTYTVVAESRNVMAQKAFIDALGPKLRALPPHLVASVDDGTRKTREFFEKNKHWYAELSDIQKIHDEVIERYDYEVGKASGLGLDLEADEAPPPLNVAALEARFKKKVEDAKKNEPGTDGYYIGGKNRTIGVVIINTPAKDGSPAAAELRKRVGELVASVNPKQLDPKMKVGYTGSLVTGEETRREITSDLAHVGLWGAGMILTVVFVFFLRLRTILCMTITIAIGCVWAFGLARYSVGYLNTATGFLVSIIAGNGINFGILYMSRYIEARRDERCDVSESVMRAHRDTRAGTFSASLAAMVAYGSLVATDFRGFQHFGLISGGGMVLCWLATYLVLPAILVLSERIAPMYRDRGRTLRIAGLYGVPFAFATRHLPRTLTVIGVAVGLLGLGFGASYLRGDPLEYNYRNIKTTSGQGSSASHLSRDVDKLVGRIKQDGKAIVTDRVDQVPLLVDELARRRSEAPKGQEPFGKIVSIFDFLPKDQQQKLPLLAEIRERLERTRSRGMIKDADWDRLNQHLPAELKPVTIAALPEVVARPFTERDGTRGRIVYLAPRTGISIYDMKYVMTWADAFREVKLPNGEVIRGSGSPVIYADMILNIREDGPKAILISFVGTVLIILMSFRWRQAGVGALLTLALGLSWLAMFLVLDEIKLNFLNFVAIPITIGVGADYAINMMKRREIEGDARLDRIIVETGGAVIACSLTTAVGYLGLLFSINGAVRSFGLLAAMGELSTLVAALLILPAGLRWHAARKQAAVASDPSSLPKTLGENATDGEN